ncbi:hypothetical protein B566_EDAN016892 [Ephemera danica]|nr:hypothetical protein B566_EDAN016892 [Ephemera danica]
MLEESSGILPIASCVYVNDKGEEFNIDSKQLAIINGTRYYFMHLLSTSLYDAQMVCKEDGMSLISLEYQYESDDVYAYIVQEQISDDYWTSGVRVGDRWLWSSTGVYLNYGNWNTGQPSEPLYPNQACIYFIAGKFSDSECNGFERSFICEEQPKC